MNTNRTHQAGLGCLILLLALAWLVTLVGQLIGVAWYWPWIFFVGLAAATMKASRDQKREQEARAKENAPRLKSFEDYKLPHLTSIPGQYTRKPCSTPDWISIPLNRDFEINCATHQVRNKHTGDIVKPGHDPYGIDNLTYIELGSTNGRIHYVRLDDIVAATLGRGHA